MAATLDVKQAYLLASNVYPDKDLVDIVDFGDRFGFVFLEWDKSFGSITREKAYDKFLITGYTTVDKTTGSIGEMNAAAYFSQSKRQNRPIRIINIEVVRDNL